MASFSTMADAEARVRAKMADCTWLIGHPARSNTGMIVVRVQRFKNPGTWVELDDDEAD